MGVRAYTPFLSWIVFVVVDRSSGPGVVWAAGAALVVAGAVLALSAHRGEDLIFPCALVVVFGATLVASLASGGSSESFGPYARAIVTGGIGLVLLGTLAVSPASASYVRSSLSPQASGTPQFQRFNRWVTGRWAFVMLVLAVLYAGTALVGGPVGRTFGDWLLPLMALVAILYLDGRNLHALQRWAAIRSEDELIVATLGQPPESGDEPPPVLAPIRRLHRRSDGDGPG